MKSWQEAICFNTENDKYCCNSKRQWVLINTLYLVSFNTASSKHIHSILLVFLSLRSGTKDGRASSSLLCCLAPLRRIPQAVNTIATGINPSNPYSVWWNVSIPQAVSAVATYIAKYMITLMCLRFNTASGKRCCNGCDIHFEIDVEDKFQYRKR